MARASLAAGRSRRRSLQRRAAGARLVRAARAGHEVRGPLCTARLALDGLERSARVDGDRPRAAARGAGARRPRRAARPPARRLAPVDVGALLRDAGPAWRALAAAHGATLAVEPARRPCRRRPARASLRRARTSSPTRSSTAAGAVDGARPRAGATVASRASRSATAAPGLPAPIGDLVAAAAGAGRRAATASRSRPRSPSATAAGWRRSRPPAARTSCSSCRRRRVSRAAAGGAAARARARARRRCAASDVARREAALREQVGPLGRRARRARRARRRPRGSSRATSRCGACPSASRRPAAARSPELLGRAALAVRGARGRAARRAPARARRSRAVPLIRRGERAAEVVGRGRRRSWSSPARASTSWSRASAARRGDRARARGRRGARRAAGRARRGATRAGPQVAATLRVTVGQAVYLAAADGVRARDPAARPRPGRPRADGAGVATTCGWAERGRAAVEPLADCSARPSTPSRADLRDRLLADGGRRRPGARIATDGASAARGPRGRGARRRHARRARRPDRRAGVRARPARAAARRPRGRGADGVRDRAGVGRARRPARADGRRASPASATCATRSSASWRRSGGASTRPSRCATRGCPTARASTS